MDKVSREIVVKALEELPEDRLAEVKAEAKLNENTP